MYLRSKKREEIKDQVRDLFGSDFDVFRYFKMSKIEQAIETYSASRHTMTQTHTSDAALVTHP